MIYKYLLITFMTGLFSIQALSAEWTNNSDIKIIFDEKKVKGTFVLYDISNDLFVGFNEARSKTRYIPGSTFKIGNSLIGLSVGAVKNVDEVLPYGGEDQPIKSWENNMSLRDAIKISNVPIYQELARRINLFRMQKNITKLNYGNMDLGLLIDRFWLDGPLQISAMEQVLFISMLAKKKLDFKVSHQEAIAEILEIQKTEEYTLYLKTGWQTATDPGIGWWVGWIERDEKIYAFALNIDMNNINDARLRTELGVASLKVLGLL